MFYHVNAHVRPEHWAKSHRGNQQTTINFYEMGHNLLADPSEVGVNVPLFPGSKNNGLFNQFETRSNIRVNNR